MLWRQFGSGHFSVKTICQCLCFSEDNCPVLWRQLGSAHFRGDNCPLIWRQFGSALFSVKTIFQCSIFLHFSPFLVKTIVLLLLILWRQLYYCYLFCEDNCTSAHEDNFTSEDNCTISHFYDWRFQKFNDILMLPSTKRIDENVRCWMGNYIYMMVVL